MEGIRNQQERCERRPNPESTLSQAMGKCGCSGEIDEEICASVAGDGETVPQWLNGLLTIWLLLAYGQIAQWADGSRFNKLYCAWEAE